MSNRSSPASEPYIIHKQDVTRQPAPCSSISQDTPDCDCDFDVDGVREFYYITYYADEQEGKTFPLAQIQTRFGLISILK